MTRQRAASNLERLERTMRNHEETIESHVASNVSAAIDQSHDYTDPNWTACDAYYQNTVDSVLEDGYTAEEAMNAGIDFLAAYAKATAAGFAK